MAELFKIYRSSAGSGKTFTLTKEYLKLVLVCPALQGGFDPFYFRKILAVTFTNLAANEMKERILEYLSEISHFKEGSAEPLILAAVRSEIKEEFPLLKAMQAAQLATRAEKVYAAILHHYADFAVSTIDSFNQFVVQSFKKDLGLPYNYELSLEEKDLLEQAVDKLLQKLDADASPVLTRLMVDFVLNEGEEKTKSNIERDLVSFGESLFNEEKFEIAGLFREWGAEQFSKLEKSVKSVVGGLEKQMAEKATSLLDRLESAGLAPSDFKGGSRSPLQYLSKIKGVLLLGKDNYKLFQAAISAFGKLLESQDWYTKSAKQSLKTAIDGAVPFLNHALNDLLAYWEEQKSLHFLSSEIFKHVYLLATLNELQQQLTVLKNEKELVLISDITERINEVVRLEPVPYIYERIGERYSHLLIDEFQDTSKKQWHNLLPLVANSLNKSGLSLVVGDAKQSIYQFRGGKPELLVDLPEVPSLPPGSPLKLETLVLNTEAFPKQLGTNFRSFPAIIQFNNRLFNFLKEQFGEIYPELLRFYADVEQKEKHKDGGLVQVDLLVKDGQEEYRKNVVGLTRDKIHQLVNEQGYKLSDITLLFRGRANAVFVAKELMKEENGAIRVVSEEALLLLSSPVVDFLFRVLKSLSGKADQHSEMLAVNFAYRHLQKSASVPSFNLPFGEWINRCSSGIRTGGLQEVWVLFKEYFPSLATWQECKVLPPYQACEQVVRDFRLFEAESEQAYLHSFLEHARAISNQSGKGLVDFVEYIERKADKLAVGAAVTEDAVRVLTIHKSKGLQFPVVIVPFAEWPASPKNPHKIWARLDDAATETGVPASVISHNKDLATTRFGNLYQQENESAFLEAVNLLYVATTRAEKQLHLIAEQQKGMEKLTGKKVSELIQAFAEFETGRESNSVFQEEKEKITSFTWQLESTTGNRASSEKKLEGQFLNYFIHTPNLKKVRIKLEDLKGESELLDVAKVNSARREGVLLHYAFEKIIDHTEVEKAVNELETEGWISMGEKKDLQERLKEVIELPEIRPYFDSSGFRIKNEQELLLGSAPREIYRPDRLMFKGKEVVLIDYKTGLENLSKHSVQVNQYAEILKKAGYDVVRKLLIYTDHLKVETLT